MSISSYLNNWPDASQVNSEARPLLMDSQLIAVYAPFRNIFSAVDGIMTKQGEMQTTLDAILKKLGELASKVV